MPGAPPPVRALSLQDCDPRRLLAAPPSHILNHLGPSDSDSSDSEDESLPALPVSSLHSGKRWEVSVKDGLVQVSFKERQEEEPPDGEEDDEELNPGDVNEDAQVCEAVLRSVFAVSFPVRSLDERLADAELVKTAFGISDQSVTRRAQKSAQYRRAELQLRFDALQKDELPSVNPEQFEDPETYTAWKKKEMEELSRLLGSLDTLPPFSGSVQVSIISVDNLKPVEPGCVCGSRGPPQLHVYTSVTVLPSRSTSSSAVDQDKEPSPTFLTDAVASTGRTDWRALSPWIPVNSAQDKVLIQVWDMQPASKLLPKKPSLRKTIVNKMSSKKHKVASWNNDEFIGQIILSYTHIESQALSQGAMRGKTPVTSYMLADEKGRQRSSRMQLQCGCSCERLHREPPSNIMLLRPPVANVEKAFDFLVSISLKSSKEGDTQPGPQWQNILSSFRVHYRIRKERCTLGIVNTLARLFQQDLKFLTGIVSEWAPVCESARAGKLTKDELALHNNIVSSVIKPAIDAIENFQDSFPGNQPEGALSVLIKLLGLALRWDPDPDDILIPLTGWVKISFEKRFYQHLFGDACHVKQPTNILLPKLAGAVKQVRQDLKDLESVFKCSFPGDVNIIGVAVSTYYKLLSGYVVNTVGASQVKLFTKECEDLVKEVLELHSEIESMDQQCDLLDLQSIFENHIIQLVTAARARMIDWVSSSVNSEKWEPLSPQTGALFSFSVVDLYFMIGEVMDELMTRLSSLPFGSSYFKQVEDATCTAVKAYVEILESLCLRELPEESIKDAGKLLLDLCVSVGFCAKMNNMNAVLEQHQDLDRRLKGEGPDEKETESEAEKLSLVNILEKHGSIKRGLSFSYEELHRFTKQALSNVTAAIVDIMQARMKSELQRIIETTACNEIQMPFEDHVQPLTTYLDEHLKFMNNHLHPSIFQDIIVEICKALLFCLEEFALNRDENPKPMTEQQRRMLEEGLSFFSQYFYGDGMGIDHEKMAWINARLLRILSCWDLNTRELCCLYWNSWDQLNSQEGGCTSESDNRDSLHLLDYLCLLKQRTDDEAREIVAQQNFIANKRLMQFMFRLPKEEELAASYPCRNNQKVNGILYVTTKHICFADRKSLTDDRAVVVISLERMMRIELSGSNSVILVPLRQRPVEFTRLADCDAVCETIFDQVRGTGSLLEKNMAPVWSEKARCCQPWDSPSAIKVLKCWRQGLLHKYSGTLLVSTAYVLFTQDDKRKVVQMDHGSILRIHAGRRGLRPSGVVFEVKGGDDCEFCDFEGINDSNKDIARELTRLIFPGK